MKIIQLCKSTCFVLLIVLSGCIPFSPYTSVSFAGEYTSFEEMSSLYSPYDDSFSAEYYHAPVSYSVVGPHQPKLSVKLNQLEIITTSEDINVLVKDKVYVTIKKPEEFVELFEASISPSGEYLLFCVTQQTGSKVYVVHLESGEYHYISDQEIVKHPRWAPDGKLIALAVGSMDNEKLGFYSIEQKKLITIGKEALINISGIKWGRDGSFLDFIVENYDSKTLPFMLVRYHFKENTFEKLYDMTVDNSRDWAREYSFSAYSRNLVTEKQLLEKSNKIYQHLKALDWKAFVYHIHPEWGLVFSPYASVGDMDDLHFTIDQVRHFESDQTKYSWSWDHADQIFKETANDYVHSYLIKHQYANDDELDYKIINFQESVVPRGGITNTIPDVYPKSYYVEYYSPPPSDELSHLWQGLRFVYQSEDQDWYLTAIVRDIHNP